MSIKNLFSDATGLALIVNILSAIIWTIACLVIGYSARRIRDFWVFWYGRRLWKPFLSSSQKNGVKIAIIAKPGSEGSSRKVSLTDVQAYSEVVTDLDVVHIKAEMVIPQQGRALEEFARSGLICLGGPVANTLSMSIFRRFSSEHKIEFKKLEHDDPNYAASKAILQYGEQDLRAEITDGYVGTDYALVLHARQVDPDFPESGPVLLAFGLRGVGTREAVRYLIRNKKDFVKCKRMGRWVLLKFSFSGLDRTTHEVIADGTIQ